MIGIGIGMFGSSGTGGGTPAFSPADIEGLQSWWDADDADSITLSGSDVSAWANKVDGAPSLVPYAVSPQIPSTTEVVGRTWIDFDVGNSQALRVTDASDAALLFGSGELTILIAYRSTRTVAQVLLNKGSNVGGRYRLRTNHGTSGDYQGVLNDGTNNVAEDSGEDSGSTDGDSHVLVLQRDNSASLMRVRLDGSEITASLGSLGDIDETSGSAFVAQLIVGAQPSGPGLATFIDGQIGEILFYDSSLAGSDRAAVESYLSTKWGV